jgi:hypothetical protein
VLLCLRGVSGDFHAPGNALAFAAYCRRSWREPAVGIRPIAKLLSVVRQILQRERSNILLFHQLPTVHDDDLRHRWVLLPEPLLSRCVRPWTGSSASPLSEMPCDLARLARAVVRPGLLHELPSGRFAGAAISKVVVRGAGGSCVRHRLARSRCRVSDGLRRLLAELLPIGHELA